MVRSATSLLAEFKEDMVEAIRGENDDIELMGYLEQEED